jgi:CRISPR-associated protein Cas2
MGEAQHLYLVCYDIRNQKRWRKAYKLIQGYGERIQYSIFRCPLTQRTREKLRWELEQVLVKEDNLLFIRLSHQCVAGIPAYNRPNTWLCLDEPYKIV